MSTFPSGASTLFPADKVAPVATAHKAPDSILRMNFTRVLANLLACGQTVRFTAPGHSMHPVIRHGDVLLVAPLERPAQPGEILLYRDAAGRPVAHRLIGFTSGDDGPALVLKGDSAAAPDLPVRPAQVFGRVSALERDGRLIDPYGVQSRLARRLHAALSRIKNRLQLLARR
jgi:signal peptidase I